MPGLRRAHPDVRLRLEQGGIVEAPDLYREQSRVGLGLPEERRAAIGTKMPAYPVVEGRPAPIDAGSPLGHGNTCLRDDNHIGRCAARDVLAVATMAGARGR